MGASRLRAVSAMTAFNFAWLQDGQFRHYLRHVDGLRPHEHALKARLPFFQEHLDDLLEVGVQFVQCFALAVSPGEAGNPSNVQPCVGVSLDYGGKCFITSLARSLLASTRGTEFERPQLDTQFLPRDDQTAVCLADRLEERTLFIMGNLEGLVVFSRDNGDDRSFRPRFALEDDL